MMLGYLLTADGGRLDLPPFTAWKLKRTDSVPCDSFEGECPWDGGVDGALESACRLILEEDGARRFTGVLDEYRLTWDQSGGVLSLSGRGMAALLLDNEARSQDYQIATLEDVLRDHVEPYGLTVGERDALGAVPGFSVASGSSEWKVLYDFSRYHCGVQPWLDVFGVLHVSAQRPRRVAAVDGRTGVTGLSFRDKRYGVCSELLVLSRGKLEPQQMANGAFQAQGGRCRRVMTMPGKSAYQAMRYSGQFQLDRSAEERFRLEFTVPGGYFCEPGDTVELALTRPAVAGSWLVEEAEAVMDEKGARVTVRARR